MCLLSEGKNDHTTGESGKFVGEHFHSEFHVNLPMRPGRLAQQSIIVQNWFESSNTHHYGNFLGRGGRTKVRLLQGSHMRPHNTTTDEIIHSQLLPPRSDVNGSLYKRKKHTRKLYRDSKMV